jgi:hypothetical protein
MAELAGHEKPGLAMQVYSGGLTLESKRKAIDALNATIEPAVMLAIRREPPQLEARPIARPPRAEK